MSTDRKNGELKERNMPFTGSMVTVLISLLLWATLIVAGNAIWNAAAGY